MNGRFIADIGCGCARVDYVEDMATASPLSSGIRGARPEVTYPPAPAGMHWVSINGRMVLDVLPAERTVAQKLRSWHERFPARCRNARPPTVPRS